MTRSVRLLLSALLTLLAASPSTFAAFIVLGNHSAKDVPITYRSHPNAEPVEAVLTPGDVRIFTSGKQPDVIFKLNGEPARYRLEPYSAYLFMGTKTGLGFQGIELAAPMPKADDVPDEATKLIPIRVPVKILVDDVDPRARPVWEKMVKQRLAAASAVIERQSTISFYPAAVDEWSSDETATNLISSLRDFEQKVKPAPASLAIGVTSRIAARPNPKDKEARDPERMTAGCTRGPLSSHLIIAENFPRSEAERVEVLVHELAHFLGAAHSPDKVSVVRPGLGDGLATNARYQMTIDPLNLLAVGIWAEELRTGKVKRWADLSPKAKSRLRAVYKTLQHVLPDDAVAGEYLNELDRGAEVAVRPVGNEQPIPEQRNPAPPMKNDPPMPKPAEPMRRVPSELEATKLTPKQEAIRKVVQAITLRAADLRRAPEPRLKGDELTAAYIRMAADIAVTLDEQLQVPAFLVGVGIALDDSTVLRENLITRDLCRAVESDEERRERLAVLSVPTIRHRRDLCQHFVVSMALTELVGTSAAEAAGLAKEFLDLDRPSGFSFADLAADMAGVAFANKLLKEPGRLGRLRESFKTDDYVPMLTGLREGLSVKRFQEDFGTATDPRFTKTVDDIRARIAALPGQR